MNKKLLFGIMSLSALAACTNDDFEGKNGAQLSEQVSPIQFEVINNAEVMRASMDGNTIQWSARDNDLFTLYHGGLSQNATYKASEGEGGAVLTTPSVIQPGDAVMVWPADTAFNDATSKAGFYTDGGTLVVKIPEVLTNVEDNIPYASDLLTIQPYEAYSETAATPAIPTAYTTAGKDRKYAVYMRPMASQLILKADYAGSDAVINALTTGSDPIDPIALTSVEINDPNAKLTQTINLKFTAPTDDPAQGTHANWNTVANNVWTKVTGFDRASAAGVNKLTTKCINGIESAKFLMLPTKENIGAGGLADANIVVNTSYGKVAISVAGGYTEAELADAWYRYVAQGTEGTYGETPTATAGTGSDASKVKYTNTIQKGLAQVIDAFSGNITKKATSVVVNEPTGAVGTRYVKVLLTKLNMDGLHVKTDKQLYDAVRVWKEIGSGNVNVYLDGDDKTGEFEISQKTIAKINEINAALAKEETPRKFTVAPCDEDGEKCGTIVFTGGGELAADLTFIVKNGDKTVPVALNKGENWKWAASTTAVKKITVATTTGIKSFINKGTFVSDANATLAIFDNTNPNPVQKFTDIPFTNNGTWNVKAGVVGVQFNVTNYGTVNISAGAEYLQDGSAGATLFTNEATTLPKRYVDLDPFISAEDKADFVEQIGLVNNSGVFATLKHATTAANKGSIYNYGLIEHLTTNAMTLITKNQSSTVNFKNAFKHDAETPANNNKMGRINVDWLNKGTQNISISNAPANETEGFVSVTVDGEVTDGELSGDVGRYVNYIIVKSGITTIKALNAQYKYVEIADKNNNRIYWAKDVTTAKFTGLIVLSPMAINQGSTVKTTTVFLGATVYLGGTLNDGEATPGVPDFNAYYGNTDDNVSTMIRTY